MSCLIPGGLLKETCQMLIGGVAKFHIANKSEVVSFNGTGSSYDSITMSTTSSFFYTFETAKNTSSYTQVLVVSGTNKNVLQTADLFISRNDQESFDILEMLALGEFCIIVETRMGKKIVLGQTNGLEATVAEVNSGVSEGDSAGIHFTLAGTQLGYGKIFEGTIPLEP